MAPRLRPVPNGPPRGQVTEIQRTRMLTAAVEAVEEVGYARLTVACSHRTGAGFAQDLLRPL
jgi:hypothetical protein